jgi:DNA polymerase-1
MKNKNLLKLLNEVQENTDSVFNKHERVLLIDGLNLFFRNFAILNLINSNGVHIGGLGGFLRSLGTLVKEIKPTSIYVVFDGPGSSASRKNMIPEYKSSRNINRITNWDIFDDIEEEHDSKINQIVRLMHYLECLPIKVLSIPKVEADDILACLSQQISSNPNNKSFIVSADKDFLQLVTNNITVYRPVEKEYYTPQTVIDKFQLTPQNFILQKTLLGDNSDNVKGIKGLGEKGLLKKFPELKERNLSLQDVFDICEKKLKEHVVYARILMERTEIENKYKIMDLSKPLVSEQDIEDLQSAIEYDELSFEPEEFIRMYNEDELGKIIKNVDFWIKENFLYLK